MSELMTNARRDLEKAVKAILPRERVVLVGGPRTGKSIVAAIAGERYGRVVMWADGLIGECAWSELSLRVSMRFDEPGPWIIEGTATVRALRKWLANNDGQLDAHVIYMPTPVQVQSEGQAAMSKAVNTIYEEIRSDLLKRSLGVIDLRE